MKNVGIIGCGWLGLPLGKKWINLAWQVKGTVRSESKMDELREKSILPYKFELGNELNPSFFDSLDVIIICLPISSKNRMEDYEELVFQVQLHKLPNTKIILTSSISVYNELEGKITEETAIIDLQSINFKVEELARKSFQDQLTILRLGGLISEDRHPITFLAGRENVQTGNEFVNLVHRSDVIEMIDTIIHKNSFGKIYNCVYPNHPLKSQYYTEEAKKRGLKVPEFTPKQVLQRIIDSNKSERELLFSYQFPI